jgi:hypothetical protein
MFDDRNARRLYTPIFDLMYEKRGPDTWDYQWLYTNLKNNSLTIVPSVNLVTNIGFGEDATHTTKADPRFDIPAKPMQFPLHHPTEYIPMRSFDRQRIKDQLPPRFIYRIFRKSVNVILRCLGIGHM